MPRKAKKQTKQVKSDHLLPAQFSQYGKIFKQVGRGKYPYECIAKDEAPDAMIYMNDTGGWGTEFNIPVSHGHICFYGGFEWYIHEDHIYKAPEDSPVTISGYRSGRWECSIAHARNYPTVYPWLDGLLG